MKKIFIGTSGWSYNHWKNGVFYPKDFKDHELLYYIKFFGTVELNTSFYHLPRKKTFANWRKLTPKNFIFSVKANRFITHILKLDNALEPLETLLDQSSALKEKLGPILFQLSPRFSLDFPRLEKFISLLPKDKRFSFEFRHKSWFCPKVYKLLKSRNVALAISDTPFYPLVKKATADFVYIRLHGHEQLYASRYTREQLLGWAKSIKRWQALRKDVYVYFDNDYKGYAPQNALELKEILGINK